MVMHNTKVLSAMVMHNTIGLSAMEMHNTQALSAMNIHNTIGLSAMVTVHLVISFLSFEGSVEQRQEDLQLLKMFKA